MSFPNLGSRPGLSHLSIGPFRDVILIRDDNATTSTAHLIFQQGEIDNTYTEGLAHFVEHLAWLSATRDFDANRHSNAWTTRTSTGYRVGISQDRDMGWLDVLLRVADPFSLDPVFALEERGIIEREYDFRVSDDAYAPIMAEVDRALVGNGPWGRDVMGARADIATFSIDDARALHAASHRLEHSVLIIYGDVDEAALYDKLSRLPGREMDSLPAWPALPNTPLLSESTQTWARTRTPRFIYRKLIELDGCAPDVTCDEALAMLSSVIGSTKPEGVGGPLRFDAFIARRYSLSIQRFGDQHALIAFDAVPDDGVSLDHLQSSFLEVFTRVIDAGLSDETVEMAKQDALNNIADLTEPQLTLRDMTLHQVANRREYYDVADIRAAIGAIDTSRLNALLEQFAHEGRVVMRRIMPDTE